MCAPYPFKVFKAFWDQVTQAARLCWQTCRFRSLPRMRGAVDLNNRKRKRNPRHEIQPNNPTLLLCPTFVKSSSLQRESAMVGVKWETVVSLTMAKSDRWAKWFTGGDSLKDRGVYPWEHTVLHTGTHQPTFSLSLFLSPQLRHRWQWFRWKIAEWKPDRWQETQSCLLLLQLWTHLILIIICFWCECLGFLYKQLFFCLFPEVKHTQGGSFWSRRGKSLV